MFGLIMSLGCILLYSALSCCMVVLTSLSSDLLAVSFIGRSLFVESSPYAYYVTNRFVETLRSHWTRQCLVFSSAFECAGEQEPGESISAHGPDPTSSTTWGSVRAALQ